jgi:hypothetical protein
VPANRKGKFRVSALATVLFICLNFINSDFAHAVTYSFQNAKLRFGTGGVDSLNNNGTLQQPFYKSASTFYKLTYSNYPLDIAIGLGGVSTGTWNTNGTIATTNNSSNVSTYTVTAHVTDYSGFISTPGVAANSGYGVITSTDKLTISGQLIQVFTKYSLGVDDAYIKIENTITNLSDNPLSNVRTWVGTRDDWVGNSDGPTKTRGNIVDGAFEAISNAATQSHAIRISSGSEGVLFYSSSAKAQTSIKNCCRFQNVINQSPTTAAISATGDGSYALFMAMNDVAVSATSETLTWFYAAGALADLATIVSNVSAANLTLSNLTISEGTLTPAFNSTGTSYSDTITASTSSITVTPTVTDAGVATVKVRANSGTYTSVTSGSPSALLAMNIGMNSVDIEVTGGDSSTAVTTINVFRPENPTITLTPSFTNTTKTYVDTLTLSISTSVYSPTGTFLFTENGAAITGCSAVVISTGTARCNWTPSITGAKTIVATYSGDSNIGLKSDTQTVTVNDVVALTSSSAAISQKYGSSRITRTVTYSGGSETKTVTATSTSLASGEITFDTATALFTIDSRTAVGTYYDTITVTDARGSIASYMQTITITQADSITVTSIDITTTYAPSTPVPGSYSITGLQNSETGTVTLNYLGIDGTDPEIVDATTIAPTQAGSYSNTPSSFTLLNGADIANYAGVIYESATVVIDRAPQVGLTIGQYNAFRGISTYPVNVYGGSDIGVITVSVIDPSTSGCTFVSERALTAVNVGSCTIEVVKAGTRNYLTETATATFYWIEWVANNTVQALPGANTTPVAGGNSVEKSEVIVTANSFTNTSGGGITSASVGNTIRILITGYEGLDPLDIEVIFRPYQYVDVISALTTTYIQVVIPAGSITGYVAINGGPLGVSHTPTFTIDP